MNPFLPNLKLNRPKSFYAGLLLFFVALIGAIHTGNLVLFHMSDHLDKPLWQHPFFPFLFFMGMLQTAQKHMGYGVTGVMESDFQLSFAEYVRLQQKEFLYDRWKDVIMDTFSRKPNRKNYETHVKPFMKND